MKESKQRCGGWVPAHKCHPGKEEEKLFEEKVLIKIYYKYTLKKQCLKVPGVFSKVETKE